MAGRHNVCGDPAHNLLNHTLGYNLFALDGAGAVRSGRNVALGKGV